jgi:signal transduction histidine kinase
MFPAQPMLANLTLGMTLALSGAMAFVFYIFVLEQKRYHPYLYRFSLFGIAFSLATAVATPLGYYSKFAPILLLLGIVALCTIPWPTRRLWKTRDLWAHLLAVAYISYGALLSINILGALALLPFNQWNIYAGMASNICHILLLHFGILLHYRRIEADHVNALEKSALAERQASLEKAHREEQDKLLAMITHEIRTPIAVIDAATQTLEALDEAPSADREERYERIRRSVNRLSVLLDLAVAQAQTNVADWRLSQGVIDPTRLTQEVIDLLGRPLADRISVAITAPLPQIIGDDRMLRFALLNLLDNACKYSPSGSPVSVTLRAEMHGVTWRVADNGPGIPVGMEEKIFEKYVRAGEIISQGGKAGLGLGLYLAHHIVERHGGTLSVETGREQGACFICWLPAHKGEME